MVNRQLLHHSTTDSDTHAAMVDGLDSSLIGFLERDGLVVEGAGPISGRLDTPAPPTPMRELIFLAGRAKTMSLC